MPEQSVFFGGKQPSGLTNMLLVLNLLGIIIVIVLLLWWWPWYWGHGHGVVKDGSTVATSPGGGNIIIDTCCDGKTTDCPGTPPPGGKDNCEEQCKRTYKTTAEQINCLEKYCNPPPGSDCKRYCASLYSSGGREYNDCVQKLCDKPTPPPSTCEESCIDKYGKGTTAADACIKDNCCEDSCKERYGSSNYYSDCVRTECSQPPPTENCEDYCKTVYGSPGMENYYQQCLQERCDSAPEQCKDTDDGLNYDTTGAVYLGQGTAPACRDRCGNSLDLQECRCLDGESDIEPHRCPYGCEDGRCLPGTTPSPPSTTSNDACTDYCQNAYAASGATYVQQCIQQHWCPV